MKTLNRNFQSVILATILFVLVIPVSAGDEGREQPRLKHFRVNESHDNYTVTATLFPAFQPDINASLLAGTPTTFKFDVYLKEVRWYWDNKILGHSTYLHTVTYDTLRKTYTIQITKDGDTVPVLQVETDSQMKMRELMTRFKGSIQYSSAKMSSNNDYYVSLIATLTTRQIPSPLNKLLFFLSSDFRTETSRKYFPAHN